MKLIYAIVRYDNEDEVINALTKKRYSITKLATTGGFLKKGNTTLMIGTDDDKFRMLSIRSSRNAANARRLRSICRIFPAVQ